MKTRLLIVAVVSAFVASLATHLIDRSVLRVRADERYYRIPGDVNGDGGMNIGDAIFILNYIFAMGPAPVPCEPCGDCAPCDGCCEPCPSVPPTRFLDLGDGTVWDRVKKLMWTRDMAGPMTAPEAEAYAATVSVGGYGDWRIPSESELKTLYASCTLPYVDWPWRGIHWTTRNDEDHICLVMGTPDKCTRRCRYLEVPTDTMALETVQGVACDDTSTFPEDKYYFRAVRGPVDLPR